MADLGPRPSEEPLGVTPPPVTIPLAGGRDWSTELTDRIGSVVGTVRGRTTVPITKLARLLVFAILFATLLTVATLLFVIALVRVLDVYLPFAPYSRRVWIVDAGAGAIFLLGGAFCWSKRYSRDQ